MQTDSYKRILLIKNARPRTGCRGCKVMTVSSGARLRRRASGGPRVSRTEDIRRRGPQRRRSLRTHRLDVRRRSGATVTLLIFTFFFLSLSLSLPFSSSTPPPRAQPSPLTAKVINQRLATLSFKIMLHVQTTLKNRGRARK